MGDIECPELEQIRLRARVMAQHLRGPSQAELIKVAVQDQAEHMVSCPVCREQMEDGWPEPDVLDPEESTLL